MPSEEEDKNSGKAPRAQYVLAEQVTRLVHGEEGLGSGEAHYRKPVQR